MVSILLSVYNGSQTLQETLESIVLQTYIDWELIIVDDASTDNSLTLLKNFQRAHGGSKVTLLHNERNLGLTKSLLRAAKHAQGEYLGRIDVGDQFSPQKLAKQMDFLETHPEYGIVGCNYVNVFLPSLVQKGSRVPLTDTDIRRTILRKNPFAHSCVVMKSSVYHLAGGYDPHIRYGQDYELWFRFLKVTKAANIADQLCTRSMGSSSLSYSKQRPQMWQTIKVQWKNMNKFSPKHYVYLLEPMAIFLIPAWFMRGARSLFLR